MIMFFDVETNGFIKDMKQPITNVDNFPRVTQLAYAVYERTGELVMRDSSLIKPDGWTVPKEKFFIEHGHSTERCEQYGIPAAEAFGDFVDVLGKVDVMVAHNMDFDSRVVGCEMFRLGLKADKKVKFCTMLKSTEILRIPNKNKYRYPGEFKWPNLQETHNFFLGNNFEDGHDAMADVYACARIFFEMVKRGHILLLQKDETM
ncbi:MAG: 3'-5' exonuclease [Saprospiraceae bacterium]|nr:3'-5' exonuclease [Saprospiraceae bacterium]